MRQHRSGLVALAVLLHLACATGGEPSSVTVALDRTSASVTVLRQRTFVATVSGSANGAVTWTVAEGAAGGAVDGGGTYTAPATPGTYHVVATSVADPARSATAVVTALAAPVITAFAASPPEVLPGGTVTLTATFADGTALLNPGMLPMTSGVPLEVAPSQSTVYVLSVTNAAGTTVAAGAAVTVSGQVAVGVLPAAVTVEQGTTLRFQALVSGTTNAAVTWSVQEGGTGGAVAADGTYTPPLRGGTYHVLATSVFDPGKQASATVTVPRAWQPPEIVSSTFATDAGLYPILRGNDTGELLIAYLQNGLLRTRAWDPATGAWGPESVLDPVLDFALGELASDGTSRLLYSYLGELKSRRWDGAAWGAEELVRTLPPVTSAYGLRISSESGGSSVAAWRESGVGTTLWAAGRTATEWVAARRADLYTALPLAPVVAMRAGSGWVAWLQNDGSYPQIFALHWDGADLGTASQLTSVPASGYPQAYSGPALGMVDDGRAFLSYQQVPSPTGAPDGWISTWNGAAWTAGLQEQAGSAVRNSAVPSRGARALRIWTHDDGGGFTFTVDGVSMSPFVAMASGAAFAADVATSGRAVLAWHEAGSGDVPNRLVAAVYDHASLEWGPRTVMGTYSNSYFSPTVAVAADGTAAAAWSATPPEGGTARVRVRHYR